MDGATLQAALAHEVGTLTIGKQKIPERVEPLHFLVAGTTGTGKSVGISEMLDGISVRRDGAFIADAGGNYLKSYYSAERGDIILNPLDNRAVSWSPLAEIESAWDADQLARSIIPDGVGSAAEWNKYAQNIVSAVLKYCWTVKLTNAEIFRLAIVAPVEELAAVFAGTPAAPMTAEGNERMFGSVRGIVGTYLQPLQYLDPAAGVTAFSLKKHVQSGRAGWLFFNFKDDQLTTLAPIIAAMADITSKALLSLDASTTRKFWLVLDEFASLGRISSILDYQTKARKNGGRSIIGVQTVAQIRSAYGKDDADTILANCGNSIIFRVPDADTADTMSRLIGEQQISRTVTSGGESSQTLQAGSSTSNNWSQQIVTERVILPSQLQTMENLRAILNLAGGLPAAPILLEPRDRKSVAATFEPTARKPADTETPDFEPAQIKEFAGDDLPLAE